jgi:hypothetical protein
MTVPSVAHPDVSVVPLSFVNLETGFVNVNQRVLNKDTVGNILAHLPFNVVHVGKLDIRVYSSTSYTIEMNLSMLGVK